jgi:hypothetical protein
MVLWQQLVRAVLRIMFTVDIDTSIQAKGMFLLLKLDPEVDRGVDITLHKQFFSD